MQHYHRIIIPVIAVLCSLPSGTFAGDGGTVSQGAARIAASVNGRAIPFTMLQPAITREEARFKKHGAKEGMSDESRKRLQRQELERLIALELLEQAGEKSLGREIERKVDEKIAVGQTPGPGADEPAKAAKRGMDRGEYRKQVRSRLLVDEYLAQRGAKDVAVPEAELEKYYAQNAGNFMEPEKVKVSHLLIRLPANPSVEELAKVQAEIEQIRVEIMAGRNFADVAKQRSACASAGAGGDLGYIRRTYMPRAFDDVAFSLKVGDISEPVRTQHGVHLIKVFDKKPARAQELGEVKDLIEKVLAGEIRKRKVDEIVRELRREANVEIFLD